MEQNFFGFFLHLIWDEAGSHQSECKILILYILNSGFLQMVGVSVNTRNVLKATVCIFSSFYSYKCHALALWNQMDHKEAAYFLWIVIVQN